MKNLYFAFLFALASFSIKAQFVTIPDTAFVTFLQTNYPACMSGNQMDTTCAGIVNETYVSCSNKSISSLEGIQYFDNLIYLTANSNNISTLPVLPQSTLEVISLYDNQLDSISSGILPSNLLDLNIGQNTSLTTIAPLPLSLTKFSAQYCPNLPLPNFHTGLLFISIGANGLTTVPPLPNTVQELHIGANFFGNISGSSLPNSITTLNIGNCNLSSLPTLPPNLKVLLCGHNNISSISNLPSSLTQLYANDNDLLTSVTNLPDSMTTIRLEDCALTFIDTLPTYCADLLDLSNNNLTSISNFPIDATEIKLNSNSISTIPDLPQTLQNFQIINNSVSCWPVFPNITNLFIQGNPHQCIPNYIPGMASMPYYDTIPICNFANATTNPQGCPTGEGIDGNLFEDMSQDCNYAGIEAPIKNTQVKVYDASGTLLETTSSGESGRYFLATSNNGTYDVVVDTLGKPFKASCTFPGADSLVTFSATDSLIEDVNFGFVCKPGFDVGVQSVIPDGWVFPGQTHNLSIKAGDLSQWYGLNCASGTSGSVAITVNGPVSYVGAPSSALVPTISGSTYSYAISDFGTVSFYNDFSLNFQTDTTAQAGDTICVSIIVTSGPGDVNPANDSYTFCYEVINSYDPNDKQVYPATVEPGYDDWLTYTIRFQNTGTAPAFNIRLEDTLSSFLDYSTFEVIGYKHANSFNLINDRLVIYFPNIMLPDSTSNEPESKGFFQFRIKPISGLQEGTDIENKAYIFFDYNDPIITNTAITEYRVNDLSVAGLQLNQFAVFPNPSNGQFYLKMDGDYEVNSIQAFSITGQSIPILYNQKVNLTEIEVTDNTKGLCFINIITDKGIISKKLFIE